MLKSIKSKNYLSVNVLITKGMLKRRRMSAAAILNIVSDKSYIRIIK